LRSIDSASFDVLKYDVISWKWYYFHLAQNAQSYAPSQNAKEEIGTVIQDIYSALSKEEAKARLKAAVNHYGDKWPKFSQWMEESCEESMSFYDYPKAHWRRIRTNNTSERLNQEIKRRTSVARLFPNSEAVLRVATAVIVEIHEEWVSGRKYLQA
jgi:putative transposase